MYSHYLITRFNVVLNNARWQADKRGNSVQTEEWLKSRFSLFDRYTIPSIKNQSCKNFKWIVLFNSETPKSFKAKIASYSADVPQFTPLYVAPEMDAKEVALRFIESDNSKGHIITTRIDNDDMIHRDYLKRIQEVFRPEPNTFLSFRSGIQYSQESETIRKFNYIKNHYTSRIESRERFESVMCNHTKIHKLGKLSIYNDKYMWVELIHSGNLANQEKRLMATNIEDTKALYGVEFTQKRVNRLSLKHLISTILYYNKIFVESVKYGFR